MKDVSSIVTFIVNTCFFSYDFSLEQWYLNWNEGTIFIMRIKKDARMFCSFRVVIPVIGPWEQSDCVCTFLAIY